MNDQNYKTYLAKIHEQRIQERREEVSQALQNATEQVNETIRNRDQAARNGVDYETFRALDREVQDAEHEYRQTVASARAMQPQRSWQDDPRLLRWAQEHPTFFERHGLQATNAVQGALAYMTRPRNPNTPHNPNYTGMARTWDQALSPQGLKEMETLLEMHGPAWYGVQFNGENPAGGECDKRLTPNEAAKVTFGKLTADTAKRYNEGQRRAAADGKFNR